MTSYQHNLIMSILSNIDEFVKMDCDAVNITSIIDTMEDATETIQSILKLLMNKGVVYTHSNIRDTVLNILHEYNVCDETIDTLIGDPDVYILPYCSLFDREKYTMDMLINDIEDILTADDFVDSTCDTSYQTYIEHIETSLTDYIEDYTQIIASGAFEKLITRVNSMSTNIIADMIKMDCQDITKVFENIDIDCESVHNIIERDTHNNVDLANNNAYYEFIVHTLTKGYDIKSFNLSRYMFAKVLDTLMKHEKYNEIINKYYKIFVGVSESVFGHFYDKYNDVIVVKNKPFYAMYLSQKRQWCLHEYKHIECGDYVNIIPDTKPSRREKLINALYENFGEGLIQKHFASTVFNINNIDNYEETYSSIIFKNYNYDNIIDFAVDKTYRCARMIINIIYSKMQSNVYDNITMSLDSYKTCLSYNTKVNYEKFIDKVTFIIKNLYSKKEIAEYFANDIDTSACEYLILNNVIEPTMEQYLKCPKLIIQHDMICEAYDYAKDDATRKILTDTMIENRHHLSVATKKKLFEHDDLIDVLTNDIVIEYDNCACCLQPCDDMIIFLDCNHQCVCCECIYKIQNKCPLCRHDINTIIKYDNDTDLLIENFSTGIEYVDSEEEEEDEEIEEDAEDSDDSDEDDDSDDDDDSDIEEEDEPESYPHRQRRLNLF